MQVIFCADTFFFFFFFFERWSAVKMHHAHRTGPYRHCSIVWDSNPLKNREHPYPLDGNHRGTQIPAILRGGVMVYALSWAPACLSGQLTYPSRVPSLFFVRSTFTTKLSTRRQFSSDATIFAIMLSGVTCPILTSSSLR